MNINIQLVKAKRAIGWKWNFALWFQVINAAIPKSSIKFCLKLILFNILQSFLKATQSICQIILQESTSLKYFSFCMIINQLQEETSQ